MSVSFELTKQFLEGNLWTWGPLNQPPLSTSFGFSANGQIIGYSHENEYYWSIIDNVIEISNKKKEVTWRFESYIKSEDYITFISVPQNDPNWNVYFGLTCKIKASNKENIRLVIWDLDDTFWSGTLSEEEISPIQRNIDIVKTLNKRGIVNAICSRNTFEDVQKKLEELNIWHEFVFPRISWGAKGPQIQDIIEKIQLRPETVLFIDDNVTNLNEAKHFVPNLNIAEPDYLETILENPLFKGKEDPKLTRLQRYRVLETKHKDMAANSGNNEDFLRKSNICVSFHSDIEAEFPRIHDLVNRTNQLNFTKNRWPEDIEEARIKFREELEASFNSDVGYIKVADAYGNYGICGFYLSRENEFLHFLFSCRTMNMGVEQFCWKKLGARHVPINGKTGSQLENPNVDWITVLDDVDNIDNIKDKDPLHKIKVCVRGACDLMMTSNFLRTRVTTIEEFNYPYEQWEIITTPRVVAAHEDLKDIRNKDIIAKLPGIPPHRFDSAILTEEADVYILSFSQESFHGLYKSRTTNMIIPMGTYHFPYFLPEGPSTKYDYTSFSYQDIVKNGLDSVSEEQWNFFKKEFVFLGGFNENLFIKDLKYIFDILTNSKKQVIILGLNDKVGNDTMILEFFSNINQIVSAIAQNYGFYVISMQDFVRSENDLANDGTKGGTHFTREVYKNISDTILKIIESTI
ncbi:HAD-IIIC family phosphatase [Acetobacter persici]|nr:HAD-IIIC family phosphatase [Acetobacter persici]